MLARYKMYRGKRPSSDLLPKGIRQDTRWRTRHPLRPTEEMVKHYLVKPNAEAWHKFREAYIALLNERFQEDRAPFDELPRLAGETDVFIGCSCPTRSNPNVDGCHTFLTLRFMRSKYRQLRIELPRVQS